MAAENRPLGGFSARGAALEQMAGGANTLAHFYSIGGKMFDFVPDTTRLAQIFSQATAPTFFLGAIAGFISLMASRLSGVMERTRALNAIPEDDPARAHLKSDLERLRSRARFLNSGILASLRGALSATLLLAVLFITEFAGLKYAYGAGWLFVIATGFLGFALFRFAQEAQISLSEADEYQ